MTSPLKRGVASPPVRCGLPTLQQQHSLTTASQDSAPSEMPSEKKIRLDPARLAFEKQLRRQAAALVDSQTQICRLQAKLQSVETHEREAKVLMDMERQELKMRTERAESKVTELASDLERLKAARSRAEEESADLRSQLRAYKTACDQEKLAALSKVTQSAQRLTEELESARAEVAGLQERLLESAAARQEAERALEQERARAAVRSDSAQERKEAEQTKLDLQTAHCKIKELESQIASIEEDARLGTLMRERLSRYPQLEEQNKAMATELKSLRHMVDRTLVLEEQVSVLQQKADKFDKLQLELETSRAECAEFRLQLATWRQAAGDDVTTPADLGRLVDGLRRQQLLLQESRGAARAELSAMETKCQHLQSEVDRLKTLQAEHEQEKLEGHVQTRKLQRKLTLVTMERDSCKRVLDAYESETTESLTSIERQRGEDQERQLATYRQQLDTLERQLQEAATSGKLVFGSADSETHAQLSAARAELEQLQRKHQQLLTEKEGLEAQLEERALRGDYNPATTRVLTLKDNPASSAASRLSGRLDRVQRENAELRARIELLQSAADAGAAPGSAAGNERAAKQLTALQNTLKASELRVTRLKEVFGKSTQEYRQAVSQLTGYKINADGKQLRLRSVYAPQEDRTLLFQRGAGDTIQLMETSFSAALPDLVEQYLYRQDSMPGFLAALTLRLLSEGAPAPAPAPAPASTPSSGRTAASSAVSRMVASSTARSTAASSAAAARSAAASASNRAAAAARPAGQPRTHVRERVLPPGRRREPPRPEPEPEPEPDDDSEPEVVELDSE